MGAETEFFKLQQTKTAVESDTVKAAITAIGFQAATIWDALHHPAVTIDVSTGLVVTPSSISWIGPLFTILAIIWGVFARFKAEGPLVWRKEAATPPGAPAIVEVAKTTPPTARTTVPPQE